MFLDFAYSSFFEQQKEDKKIVNHNVNKNES